jgi:hypothetical protein
MGYGPARSYEMPRLKSAFGTAERRYGCGSASHCSSRTAALARLPLLRTVTSRRRQACQFVAPAVDVDIYVRGDTAPVIGARDWLTIDPRRLLERVDPRGGLVSLPSMSARFGPRKAT